MDGISGEGKSAEELFRSLTGATEPAKAATGDAVLDGHHVEVKKVSKSTLNRVRAVKYLPLVAYQPEKGWYVVPAHDVVRLVAEKTRGQHTENPFESATLNLSALDKFHVSKDGLRAAVLAAVAAAARHPELKAAMERILVRCKALAKESRDEVRRLLE